MKNNITVNMENLSVEERKQLISLVEKSNQPKPKKRWRADYGEYYYTIFSDGYIDRPCENNHSTDDLRYKLGNYFKTPEEVKFELEKRLVYQELKDYAMEHNNGEIDWDDENQYKYYIFYTNRSGILLIDWCKIRNNMCGIYFTSKQIAQNAIETIGEDRIKKYIFGID